jgi:hypothetical protein
MSTSHHIKMIAVAAALVGALSVSAAVAGEAGDIGQRWAADSRTLGLEFRGQPLEYPRDLGKGTYPQPESGPDFDFEKDWPAVTMKARWSISMKSWPASERAQALDVVLLRACDAGRYTRIFPDFIRSSTFTAPPEFVAEIRDPEKHKLAESLNGSQARYDITARAGFGAADYDLSARIRFGVSADGRAVFYHDHAESISDHLTTREFILAVQEDGDMLRFEVVMLGVCQPRRLFRGETLRRIEDNGRYYVQRLYEELSAIGSR